MLFYDFYHKNKTITCHMCRYFFICSFYLLTIENGILHQSVGLSTDLLSGKSFSLWSERQKKGTDLKLFYNWFTIMYRARIYPEFLKLYKIIHDKVSFMI